MIHAGGNGSDLGLARSNGRGSGSGDVFRSVEQQVIAVSYRGTVASKYLRVTWIQKLWV